MQESGRCRRNIEKVRNTKVEGFARSKKSNLKEPLAVGSKMMMLTVRCACKTHTMTRVRSNGGFELL